MGKQRPTRRKLAQFFNWKIIVTLTNDRVVEGIIMGVDKHINIVLKDAEEKRYYKVKNKEPKELKRMLGLTVVRGTEILHVVPESNTGLDLCDTPLVMERKNVQQARDRSNKGPPPGVSAISKDAPPPHHSGLPSFLGAGRGGMPFGMRPGGPPMPGMMMPGMMMPGMMPPGMMRPGMMPGMMRPGFPMGGMRPGGRGF
eukprot:GEMP01046483.1.p1 GENE.GEMP01046483.1~~GEMP01046483.1.p1  ORF type:complete len:199 (+),score=35.31 GEMP01046483.1:71-667(+)